MSQNKLKIRSKEDNPRLVTYNFNGTSTVSYEEGIVMLMQKTSNKFNKWKQNIIIRKMYKENQSGTQVYLHCKIIN